MNGLGLVELCQVLGHHVRAIHKEIRIPVRYDLNDGSFELLKKAQVEKLLSLSVPVCKNILNYK